MPNAFAVAGAQSTKQPRYAPIHTNRFFTGYWTYRNPLRDPSTPYLYEKFYSGTRYDAIIDGQNTEVNARLTLVRRPGLSQYNSQTFPSIKRFYSFRQFTGSTETIKVLADTSTDGTHSTGRVYDATGPSTKTNLFDKSTGAGQTYFQAVGNTLYTGNGVDQKQWGGSGAFTDWGIAPPSTAPTVANVAFQTWAALTPYGVGNGVLSYVYDSNNNLQLCTVNGTSGAVVPTWNTATGGTTIDGTVTWTNQGPWPANTGAWIYCFSYMNSTTGDVTTASPLSIPITMAAGSYIRVTGTSTTATGYDKIVIFRTAQGGATEFYLDKITQTVTTWTYTDANGDQILNELIQAPVNGGNNPPPAGLINLTYHVGRIFGSVGNTVYASSGPDVVYGNGNTAFPSSNNWVFPSLIKRLWPTAVGLIVFTLTDIYAILGAGTPNSPLYSVPWMEKIGLADYNSFDVEGTIPYFWTSDGRFIRFDPQNGYDLAGLPIWDVMAGQASLATDASCVYVACYGAVQTVAGVGYPDNGVFFAVATNGSYVGRWFRLSQIVAPETGFNWSPPATLNQGVTVNISGFSAVQTIEVSPGVRRLLIGPNGATTPGLICYRDPSKGTDLYSGSASAYVAYSTIGSLVLAQPGQLADPAFIEVDSPATSSDVSLTVYPDNNILWSGGSTNSVNLVATSDDPPTLTASTTFKQKRYAFVQQSNPAQCRHLQIRFDWANGSTTLDEILGYTIFGKTDQDES